MTLCITREVSPAMNQCELTHLERQPIDISLAREQHHAYEEALAALGCEILRLPPEPDLPDSVFVEDTALVFPEAAVITRPGADSRKPECASIETALTPYRPIRKIEAPATLDGGDVLVLDKEVFVGLSTRSNEAAISQLQDILAPYGYRVRGVPVTGCLHLKSAVSRVGERLLLLNPDWVDERIFEGFDIVHVHPEEPYAANAVYVNGGVVYPAAFPKTLKRLQEAGLRVHTVDISELAKAEGAVTCCSLVVS